MVEIFPSDCSYQPFNEWMGHRNVWNGSDWFDFKDAQICFPLFELKDRCVVEAQAFWEIVLGDNLVKHSAN